MIPLFLQIKCCCAVAVRAYTYVSTLVQGSQHCSSPFLPRCYLPNQYAVQLLVITIYSKLITAADLLHSPPKLLIESRRILAMTPPSDVGVLYFSRMERILRESDEELQTSKIVSTASTTLRLRLNLITLLLVASASVVLLISFFSYRASAASSGSSTSTSILKCDRNALAMR